MMSAGTRRPHNKIRQLCRRIEFLKAKLVIQPDDNYRQEMRALEWAVEYLMKLQSDFELLQRVKNMPTPAYSTKEFAGHMDFTHTEARLRSYRSYDGRPKKEE